MNPKVYDINIVTTANTNELTVKCSSEVRSPTCSGNKEITLHLLVKSYLQKVTINYLTKDHFEKLLQQKGLRKVLILTDLD